MAEEHKSTHKNFLIVLGIALILLGILGFLFQGLISFSSTSTTKNTIYLIIGGIVTVIGTWSNMKTQENALWGISVIFAMLGVIAFFGFVQQTIADAIFSLAIAAASFIKMRR